MLASSVNAFARGGKGELYCRDLNDGRLYSLYENVGDRPCDDALNLLSVYNDDYEVCYKGSVDKARKLLKKNPISYEYYNKYRVDAFLSDKDRGGDIILFQIKEFSAGQNRIVSLIGEIDDCSASDDDDDSNDEDDEANDDDL